MMYRMSGLPEITQNSYYKLVRKYNLDFFSLHPLMLPAHTAVPSPSFTVWPLNVSIIQGFFLDYLSPTHAESSGDCQATGRPSGQDGGWDSGQGLDSLWNQEETQMVGEVGKLESMGQAEPPY